MRSVGLIVWALLVSSSSVSYAKQCLSIDDSSPKLTWTGYKFTEKLGVNGTFDNIEFTQTEKSGSLKALLESIAFKIEVASLNTGVEYRDKKLVLFVFGHLVKPGEISGKVLSYDPGKSQAVAEIHMNGKSVKVPFKLVQEKSKLTLSSQIDMLSFGMQKSFANIQQECKALHTGADGKSKSWSTVGLKVEASLKSSC